MKTHHAVTLGLAMAICGGGDVGDAMAQPGAYAPPPPASPQGYYSGSSYAADGYYPRAGRMVMGAALGLGGMSVADRAVTCSNCAYNPAAVGVAAHIGGMLSNQLGLMFEAQGNYQTVEARADGNILLAQSTALIAAQYWASPRLWLKGGVGFAVLSTVQDSTDAQTDLGAGGAALFAAGYELLATPTFAVDLQGRFLLASYDGLQARSQVGTVGVGFSFY